MKVRKLRARANMILGAGIIALVLLSLGILYTPRIFGLIPGPGEPIVSETYIEDVPFRYQAKNYTCAPASLDMVFAFYGPDIYQYYISQVARTKNDTGTGGWDILRAGHFSNLSSSIGDDDPWFDCTGYPGRDLGYASFYWASPDNNFTEAIDYLYDLVDDGYPIIVALWPDLTNPNVPSILYDTGHCVVVVGYGNNTYTVLDPVEGVITVVNHWVKVHDPWNPLVWGGVGGPDFIIDLDEFKESWSSYNCSMYFIHPLMVDVTGVSVNATSTFVVTANITYPCPSPFSRDAYPASNCTTTIDIPPYFSLSPGETLTKTVGPGGIMTAGSSSTVSWNVTAASEASSYEVEVEAEGNVSEMNWMGPPNMQPKATYNYTDRIGGSGRGLVTVHLTNYTLALYEGWNLIGLPCTPEDSGIEVVLADILDDVEIVWSYQDGEWSFYLPAVPEIGTLTDLVEGRGYWFNMNADAILTIYCESASS